MFLALSMDFNVSIERTNEGVLSALAKLYEKPSSSNKVFLIKHLYNMKMPEGGYIVDHLNEFNALNNQLSYVGVKFDDEFTYILILFSLSEIWNGLVMVVCNYVSISNTLKFDDVVGVNLSEEMGRKSTCETSRNEFTIYSMGRQRER